ncbi:MAG: hypothetical protein ABJP48_08305 [Erythrobacter sp.]
MPFLEVFAGAASGAILLAVFVRLPAKPLANYGFLVFAIMLSIYLGARLVTGSFGQVVIEFAAVNIALGLAKFAMSKWLPSIGLVILMHGAYDAVFGPHTGIAEWYPPLCAGFDLVVGFGLIFVLMRKTKKTAVLTQ